MAEDPSRKTVTVRIAGEEHVLRSTAPEPHTRRCADFLDDRIREIREHGTFTESHRAVILAALSITDRYLRAQEELERLRREVTSRSLNLARRVEDELEPPPSP
jgi:cell division protein ZapA (FtsZ GTPase activity inhibitor)